MLTAELWPRCKAVKSTKTEVFLDSALQVHTAGWGLTCSEVKITADLKLVDDKEIKQLTLPKKEVWVGRYPGS